MIYLDMINKEIYRHKYTKINNLFKKNKTICAIKIITDK